MTGSSACNRSLLVLSLTLAAIGGLGAADSPDADTSGADFSGADFSALCGAQAGTFGERRIVCADIAALDQTLVYNRFGSFNPFGMMYALRRDLSALNADGYEAEGETIVAPRRLTADDCRARTGTEPGGDDVELAAGNVRLKDCKRPRPITLRVNVGDVLLVRVANLLHPPARPDTPDAVQGPGFSQEFCHGGNTLDASRSDVHEGVARGPEDRLAHGEVACAERKPDHGDGPNADAPAAESMPGKGVDAVTADVADAGGQPAHPRESTADWPSTRLVNFVVQGLEPVPDPVSGEVAGACLGLDAVAPGEQFLCMYEVDQEGMYFLASPAAPAGGEGDGGSIVHGLFGAVLAEREGSRWYRSQTSAAAFDAVWPAAGDGRPRHSRSGLLDYEKVDEAGAPYLNMARPVDGTSQAEFATAGAVELMHSDLNAIVFCDARASGADCPPRDETASPELTREPAYTAFREFSVFFHDELKTFYTRNFQDIESLGQMAGVKDGFALNYGASGMGSILMANRKGIGPAADCMECLYEEFFLTSWANGDPALLERFADDPSNVHHSYLNDPVVFRNFHAGPKETHVFHLHAHQWFAGNDPNRGAYLDSQTVAPQQGFSYNIYHGGRRDVDGDARGWWDTQGSGNRNRTIGDSIFHCHLYPHFAQGMWALWRVHDTLEDGTRLLPDGQAVEGLSIDFPEPGGHKRGGSVDRLSGAWHEEQRGTPVPALIPLPGEPIPLLPTYAEAEAEQDERATPMPGYPFYVAGQPGHRPPQAPLDIAQELTSAPASGDDDSEGERTPSGNWLHGGLGRHVVADGSTRELGIELPDIDVLSLDAADRSAFMSQVVAKSFALGDLSGHLSSANIELLDNHGTELERAAMGFHHDGELYDPQDRRDDDSLSLRNAFGEEVAFAEGAYGSIVMPLPGDAAEEPRDGAFAVNGSAPKPGAPFADPCGAPDGLARATRLEDGDPLFAGQSGAMDTYAVDPLLRGFRRYEVSAVQLDLIVNQAGWHDPQARINVLTEDSGNYKESEITERISPVISDNDEPFFFRAMSGECIEFRHTNEVPKELELDDFQVRTPTDTIGQHIHLVKFDVTSSDGSANGWNYEDGTFAADELALRRCAATAEGGSVDDTQGSWRAPEMAECSAGEPVLHDIWRLPLADHREKFQTTVQRWFADPILSSMESGMDRDRTMRTVFTHDHFAPSSIQQHGFYSALVVEPDPSVDGSDAKVRICDADGARCVSTLEPEKRLQSVARGGDVLSGTRKQVLIEGDDPIHPSYREFALSIADFALLYDPRDRSSESELKRNIGTDPNASSDGRFAAGDDKGMFRLYCEARWRQSPYWLENVCGNVASIDEEDGSWFFAGDVPPAWIAGGTFRDDRHKERFRLEGVHSAERTDFGLIDADEVSALREHAIAYRRKAAGRHEDADPGEDEPTLASPVAPPERPEAISVDHHDPYLVNYRSAPIALRIGDKRHGSGDATLQSEDCRPKPMSRPGVASRENGGDAPDSAVVKALARQDGDAGFAECSVARQVEGERGDLAGALLSTLHGDPETPVFEAYQGERMVFRLIQGAQEVQHTFNVAGLAFKRNIDQAFPRGMQPLGRSAEAQAEPGMRERCFEAASSGRPARYRDWLDRAPADPASPLHDDPSTSEDDDEVAYWRRYQEILAGCDNIEGFTFAQEVGISEHFEMQGSLRSDVPQSVEFAPGTDEPDAAAALPDNGQADEQSDGRTAEPPPDYLYDFGSVDALWNGAWGLTRIYPDGDTLIPGTDRPIATRLGTPVFAAGRESATNEAAEAEASAGLACPRTRDGRVVRHTEAVIVALETSKLWPGGTPYGSGRRDPDGLMLALLDPESLVEDGFRAPDSAWRALEEARVLAAVDARYARPQPMTLRVNAGDCVRLRLVNLLQEIPAGGLRDHLGDAELPPIVPLNADPASAGVRIEHDARERGDLARVGTLARPDGPELPMGGLRPSASLALSIGLPGMNLLENLPRPYGNNRPALPPHRAGSPVPVSEELRFYAGRFRLDLDPEGDVGALVARLETRVRGDLVAVPGGWLTGGAFTYPASGTTADELFDAVLMMELGPGDTAPRGFVEILGTPYGLSVFVTPDQGFALPEGQSEAELLLDGSERSVAALVAAYCREPVADACRAQATAAVAGLRKRLAEWSLDELDARTHWIPYAFGAVPVRSVSDVISHVQHGLFGAIDVLPIDWPLTSGHGVTSTSRDARDPGIRYRSMSWIDSPDEFTDDALADSGDAMARPLLDGDPAVFEVPVERADGSTATTRLREFVLFYQDGLNLWDDDSRIDWRWDDGRAVIDHGEALRTVPDCPVCDDSYDRGEYGVNYRSPAFSELLDKQLPEAMKIDGSVEASDDLNVFSFPADFLDPTDADARSDNTIRLKACPGEQVVIRVIHPGGRARQRAFAVNGYDYEDLFPGFGFPRSALLAPGKSISAWLSPDMVAGRTTLWHDGPTPVRSGGAWGLLDVSGDAESCPG